MISIRKMEIIVDICKQILYVTNLVVLKYGKALPYYINVSLLLNQEELQNGPLTYSLRFSLLVLFMKVRFKKKVFIKNGPIL